MDTHKKNTKHKQSRLKHTSRDTQKGKKRDRQTDLKEVYMSEEI